MYTNHQGGRLMTIIRLKLNVNYTARVVNKAIPIARRLLFESGARSNPDVQSEIDSIEDAMDELRKRALCMSTYR